MFLLKELWRTCLQPYQTQYRTFQQGYTSVLFWNKQFVNGKLYLISALPENWATPFTTKRFGDFQGKYLIRYVIIWWLNWGGCATPNQRREEDTSVREQHSKLLHGGKSIFSEGINDIHKQQMALLSLGLFCRSWLRWDSPSSLRNWIPFWRCFHFKPSLKWQEYEP